MDNLKIPVTSGGRDLDDLIKELQEVRTHSKDRIVVKSQSLGGGRIFLRFAPTPLSPRELAVRKLKLQKAAKAQAVEKGKDKQKAAQNNKNRAEARAKARAGTQTKQGLSSQAKPKK